MKTHFSTTDKFVKKNKIQTLKKNGLLCPIVLDPDGIYIRSGAHRHQYFKDKHEIYFVLCR